MSSTNCYQLFHGGVSTWQVHLRAASELVLSLHGISSNINSRTPTSQHQSASPSQSPDIVKILSDFQSSPDNAALNFFTGAILWFDILACVSTGLEPYLANYHDRLLLSASLPISSQGGPSGPIELHTIMGCRNWMMVVIGRIATLKMWRGKCIESGTLDINRVAETAGNIQLEIEFNCSRISEELNALREQYSGPPPHHQPQVYKEYTALVVTQIFACAGLIYLQTVVSSDPSVLHIQGALQNIKMAMSLILDPRMFRGLVWPLCVAGCMASSQRDQEFFRNTVESAILDSPRFGNSGQALQILEKSWELQQERGRLIDCATVIQELGACILLV